MEQICQLSKSVSCPPQALAYQAHLSLSCPCLLISVCISLSLPPEGKDSRTDTECKSHSGFYTLPGANTGKKRKKRKRNEGRRGRVREMNQSKNMRQRNQPKDKTIILIYCRVRIIWDKGLPKKKKNTHHQRDSSHNIWLPWSQRDQRDDYVVSYTEEDNSWVWFKEMKPLYFNSIVLILLARSAHMPFLWYKSANQANPFNSLGCCCLSWYNWPHKCPSNLSDCRNVVTNLVRLDLWL